MKLIDPYDWFFMSIWRRLLIVVLTFGWGVFELYNDEQLWGMLFGGIGFYCVFVFIRNPIKHAPQQETEVD